jgi:hypothetical protein
MVPMSLIIVIFIVAFLLVLWQYNLIDPKRRIVNLRFVMMVCALVVIFGYPFYNVVYPNERHTSWVCFVAGLIWLIAAAVLFRYMPPRQQY